MERKLRLGLLGKNVANSDSPRIHTFILQRFGVECEYEKISASDEDFDCAMRRLLGDFDGFNVTIPYKRDVMEYLDEIVGDALDFSAVNTITSANRVGFNTDGVGFLWMIEEAGILPQGKKVLILGGGGSGRSTAMTLKKAGAEVFMYRRNRHELEETCRELSIMPAENGESGGYDILVNCTGVGMHDSEGRSPVGAAAFQGGSAAIDLIYRPAESEFLRLAKTQGLQTLNGAAMLFYQAYYADCLYLGIEPNQRQAIDFYKQFKENYEGRR